MSILFVLLTFLLVITITYFRVARSRNRLYSRVLTCGPRRRRR